MRRASWLAVVLVASGCSGGSQHFTGEQVRAGFASAGYHLTSQGYRRWGPARRVHYLFWWNHGGVHMTKAGVATFKAGKEFWVLVFPSSHAAEAALNDRSVHRYLRVTHIPAARRGNVVLTDRVRVSKADWNRWTAALSRVGR